MNPEKENAFLNLIMQKYLRRPCSDEDAKLITLKYKESGNYSLIYKGQLLGVVRKHTLFGKQHLKFTAKK
jgi:hypothetical protein